MTKGQGVREYRACTRCRSRKVKCDLKSVGEPGKPPCAKCRREGAECLLGGSRRGGDYSRHRRSAKGPNLNSIDYWPSSTGGPSHHHTARPHAASLAEQSVEQETSHNAAMVHDCLQNPSDALLILAHAAGRPEDKDFMLGSSDDGRDFETTKNAQETNQTGQGPPTDVSNLGSLVTTSSFALWREGTLSLDVLLQLLSM